jgi:hypothetical protein
MEIDKETYKSLLLWFLNSLQTLETELLVYKTTMFHVEQQFPGAETYLEVARQAPTIRDAIESKYGPLRQTLSQIIDESALDQALEEFLRGWKPAGSRN